MTGVKGRSGRKHHSFAEAGTQQIIDGAAPKAAAILRDHIQGKRKRLSSSLQKACEYVIDHAIGKSRQKVEHSGGILTYAELAKSADDLDSKPRDILADVEEIANKHRNQIAENDT